MSNYVYNVGELRALVKEARQEFKPVLGPDVKRNDEKNNSESYKEAKKRAKDFDGGLEEPKKKEKLQPKYHHNADLLDYDFATEPSDEYKERVKAQTMGYDTVSAMKSGTERGGVEMDDDARIYKWMSDAHDKRTEERKMRDESGLQARMYPKGTFDRGSMFKESKNTKEKKLKFKHTKFLNEEMVLSRIPEEYKKDGQRIHMSDSYGNEYVVECQKINSTGNVEVNIVSKSNKLDEQKQVDRIFELMDYKTPKGMTPNDRVNESKEFSKIMDMTRATEE